MASYSLFAGWMCLYITNWSVGDLELHVLCTYLSLTQLPELSSLFTPPWLLQPSGAWQRLSRVSRARSGANPRVLQPRTFLAFLCQLTVSLLFPSCWFRLGYRPSQGGWVSQPGQNFPCMKKMSIFGSDINVTCVTSQQKSPCSLLIPLYLLKQTNIKEHWHQVNYLPLNHCHVRFHEYVPIT